MCKKNNIGIFANTSAGIEKRTTATFRSFVGSLVNAPRVFKFCVKEGQLVNH